KSSLHQEFACRQLPHPASMSPSRGQSRALQSSLITPARQRCRFGRHRFSHNRLAKPSETSQRQPNTRFIRIAPMAKPVQNMEMEDENTIRTLLRTAKRIAHDELHTTETVAVLALFEKLYLEHEHRTLADGPPSSLKMH